jgi:CRISPR-associated endonuclease/helicase Cas3
MAQFDENPGMFDNDLASLRSIGYYYKLLFSSLNTDTQDYPNPIDGNKPTLLAYLSDNQQFYRDGITRKERSKYFYCQCFETAGALFTVFDNLQENIIVPYNEEAKEIIAELQTDSVCYNFALREELLRKAKNYSVSIFNFTFDFLNKKGAILQIESLGVSCLKDEFYDVFTGISTKEVNECNTLMM